MEEKTEGIILQAIPYQDHDEILKVFTPNGLIALFAKGSKRKGKENLPPFTLVDWVLEETKGELYKLKEAKTIKNYFNLRNSLTAIQGASLMAEAVLQTQAPEKEARALYLLFLSYLERFDKNPPCYLASFRLKTLIHEGLLSEYALRGFLEEEMRYVEALSFLKQRSLIEDLQIDQPFCEKIEKLFFSSI